MSLDRSPTTLISGKNGSGKSVLSDAIYFALFGKAYRNINKPQLVNSVNQSGLEVILTFNNGKNEYRIVRGIKPALFEIYENDILINQDSAKYDYQKYLEDNILGGLNEKVFKQIVIMASADYKPFMQLPAAERREIVEELLDIKIFSHMLANAKQKAGRILDTIKQCEYDISLIDDKIQLRKKLQQSKNDDIQSSIKSLQDKIAVEQKKIDTWNINIAKNDEQCELLSGKLSLIEPLKTSISETKNLLLNTEQTQKGLQKSIKYISENDTCSVCKQSITTEHKHKVNDEYQTKLNELSQAIIRIDTALQKKLGNLELLERVKKKTDFYQNENTQWNNNIKSSKKIIQIFESDIKKLLTNDKNDDILLDCNDLIMEKEGLEKNKQTLANDYDYYGIIMDMLKDGGIKTRITKQFIPVMNNLINEYLDRFGLSVNFVLDETFSETIKSRYRDSFTYNCFSEGEKQRIDLSLLLVWREIAKRKNTVRTNLLIFDETFDSSLDAIATEELINILLEMSSMNIFIISHKVDLSDKCRSVIEFEKRGNFTVMK